VRLLYLATDLSAECRGTAFTQTPTKDVCCMSSYLFVPGCYTEIWHESEAVGMLYVHGLYLESEELLYVVIILLRTNQHHGEE
jgi:hypothetical protein